MPAANLRKRREAARAKARSGLRGSALSHTVQRGEAVFRRERKPGSFNRTSKAVFVRGAGQTDKFALGSFVQFRGSVAEFGYSRSKSPVAFQNFQRKDKKGKTKSGEWTPAL